MVIDDASRDSPARCEWAAVALLLGVFLVINLLTAALSPTVWADETLFADPAWHLARGEGLTSTFWPQPRGTFFATNVPLYSVLLAGWMKVFGFSPRALRALNIVLITLAAGCVWLGVRRGGLIRSARAALLLLLVLLLSGEVTTITRNGRYDALCALGCSVAFLSATLRSKRARDSLAFVAGIFLPLAGFQMTLYVAGLGVVLLIFWPKRVLQFLLWLGAGIAAGLCTLVLVLVTHDALDRFVFTLRLVKPLQSPPGGIREWVHAAIAHPTLAIGGAVLVVLAVDAWRRGRLRARSPETFGILAAIIIPLALGVFYHFRGEYGWMISAPVLIPIVMSIERVDRVGGVRYLASAGLAIIALIGFPLTLANAINRAPGRDYARVEAFVARNVEPADRAAIDAAAFYPVRRISADCVGRYHLNAMAPADKVRISVLVIHPSIEPIVQRELGGKWHQVAHLPPIYPKRLKWLHYPGDKMVYELSVYRRDAD
jgi:hypothetical protein